MLRSIRLMNMVIPSSPPVNSVFITSSSRVRCVHQRGTGSMVFNSQFPTGEHGGHDFVTWLERYTRVVIELGNTMFKSRLERSISVHVYSNVTLPVGQSQQDTILLIASGWCISKLGKNLERTDVMVVINGYDMDILNVCLLKCEKGGNTKRWMDSNRIWIWESSVLTDDSCTWRYFDERGRFR